MSEEPARTTERRRSPGRRHADRLQEAGFADAFTMLSDGILLTDAAGVVVSANPAAGRILGVEELVGATFDDLAPIRRAPRRADATGRQVRRLQLERDERQARVEVVTTPLSSNDGRHIHTVRDVTAQEELLRLKEDFMLQVAHELRTPITALSASLDLLLQDALSMPRDQLAALVRTLGRSALRLENLVENLLDAGSIEAGTFQVHALPTFLSRAIQNALVFAQPVLEGKSQRLVLQVAREAETVVADPRRTAQVLTNLLTNASKYSPEGSAIELRAEPHGGFIRVTVRDEGPGIAVDEQAKIFDRFFRSREVRAHAGGIGLGLAISRAIVEAQGGKIGIVSAPGAGTSIHFTLPRARERAEEAEQR